MKYVFLSLFIVSSFFANAQRFSSEMFHKGFIVTVKKDTLKGDLKYDMETNAVSIISRGKIKSFSSQKVAYFEFFDQLQNNYRRFYALPYQVNYGYKTPIFFELLFEGKISLISREQIVQQTVNAASPYWGGGTVTQLVIEYSFFFLDNKGKITFFTGKKKDLYAQFPRFSQDMKMFIKDNRLDVSDRADLIRIMAFYNSI